MLTAQTVFKIYGYQLGACKKLYHGENQVKYACFEHSLIFFYRFVRYTQPSAVYKAAAELNGWTLNGAKLVVEISQDTCEKMKQGNCMDSSIQYTYCYTLTQ